MAEEKPREKAEAEPHVKKLAKLLKPKPSEK